MSNLGRICCRRKNEGIVVFRNGSIVTSEYTILGNTVYHTQTGTLAYQTEEVIQKVAEIRAQAELAAGDFRSDHQRRLASLLHPGWIHAGGQSTCTTMWILQSNWKRTSLNWAI